MMRFMTKRNDEIYDKRKKILLFVLTAIYIISSLWMPSCVAQPSDWAKKEVEAALAEGFVTSQLTEDYKANITREEFCELVILLYEKISENNYVEEYSQEVIFTDTNNISVMKAYRLGIIKGVSEEEFAPHREINRQEACAVIVRAIKQALPEADISIHPDYKYDDKYQIDLWAKPFIDYAYYYGIINGVQPYVIEPMRNISREEAIIIVYRTYEDSDEFKKQSQGFIDWEWAIDPEYDGLVADTRFSGGLAAVKKNGKYGFIDTKGNVKIDFAYTRAYDFSEGLAKVEQNGKVGFVNKNGETVVPIEYEDAGFFKEGCVWVVKNGKYGFVDKTGKEIIPTQYDYAYPFSDGIAPVKKDGLYGYIDKDENTVINFKFKWASSFSEGLARVGKNGKYGYINRDGEVVIDMIYDYVHDFRDERAIVHFRDFIGVIDGEGNQIVDFYIFTAISNYHEGIAFAQYEGSENPDYSGKRVFLTKDGEVFSGINSNIWDDFNEGLVRNYSTNLRYGVPLFSYRDKTGKNVLPLRASNDEISEFDDKMAYIMPFSEGLAAIVNKQGKLGFIKNPLIPCFD